MKPPLIGITTYGQNEQRQFVLPREYVDCVRRAGGAALLLPPGESCTDELLVHLDGLVLAGGGDIDPAYYLGRRHETIYNVDGERDVMELEIARQAIDRKLPTLAICRGIQIVNIVQGGTLIEHLPDEVGEAVMHRLPPRVPTEHPVRVAPGSRLAGILGATDFSAASWHHQAIRDLGRGLQVVAHAADGTIEAVEMPDHPGLIAVQWHPELTAQRDPVQQGLFDHLVQTTIQWRAAKP